MKRRSFIVTVILANIAFVLLQVDKHNRITQYMYQKQRIEADLQHINKDYNQLKQEFCDLQHHKTIKAYARRYLHMQPISLKQIKKFTRNA